VVRVRGTAGVCVAELFSFAPSHGLPPPFAIFNLKRLVRFIRLVYILVYSVLLGTFHPSNYNIYSLEKLDNVNGVGLQTLSGLAPEKLLKLPNPYLDETYLPI